ncbi:MAG TPA: DUF3224 domain-containing protein [Xanthomonadaceae bacterium]|jgi:hypothetical protein|nr:DUF3224 domain-containing protein [Xanthomonadaceae bacterium]
MPHATGPFDVQLAPLPAYNQDEGAALFRMSIDKQFHGALEAVSRGEMLATRAGDAGGYVAIERVTGSLDGRAGSFVLQHSSTMDADGQEQHVQVAPGSGTGALAGLRGRMRIVIAGGAHRYEFDYTLPGD